MAVGFGISQSIVFVRVLVIEQGDTMPAAIWDHDRLDVYRLAVDYTADSDRVAEGLSGLRRHTRDQ